MILENYINFEIPIHNELVDIEQLTSIKKLNEIIQSDTSHFFVLFNLGNIITIGSDNRQILCPPKNGVIGIKKGISIDTNTGQHFRATLLTLRNSFKENLLEKIITSINQRYSHIFSSCDFIFDFPLTINLIGTMEALYKTQNNTKCYFYLLEIESLTTQLFIHILRTILNLDQKYIEQFTTFDTKYYTILKTFFDHPVTFTDTLDLYGMPMDLFREAFNKKKPGVQLENYLEKEKNNSKDRIQIPMDIEDEIEEAQEI